MRAAPASIAVWVSWPQACIRPGTVEAKSSPVSSGIGSASMSPRSSTRAARLAGVEDRDRAGARGALAPFERQVGELGADLGERLGRLEAELGLGMDRAAERGDAVGDAARILQQVFGQHGRMHRPDRRAVSRVRPARMGGTPNAHHKAPNAAIAAVSTKALP